MPFRILLFIFLLIPFIGMSQSNLIAQEQYFQNARQSRSSYQYDAQGREIAAKYYSATFNGSWGLHTSEEKKFDDAGRVIYNSTSGWKYADDSLYYHSETSTTYNEDGKILTDITDAIYDISGPNEQHLKTEKIYEYEAGCLITISTRIYFEYGGYYESKERYENDNQCRPLKRTNGGDVTIWKYASDNTYTEYQYNINESDSTLITETHYANSHIIEVIYSRKDRLTNAYNQLGSIVERKRFQWEVATWVLKEVVNYTYNASNQLVRDETLVGPDVESQPLQYQSQTKYEYNDLGSVKYMESSFINVDGSSSLYGTTISFRCDGQPVTWVSKDLRSGNEYMKIFYFYSSAATCESPSVNFSLFPNPTTRYLKINTIEQLDHATLKIYNTAGQLLSEILDTENMSPIEIDLGHLIPGSYVLKVESNSTTFSGRFVKQ